MLRDRCPLMVDFALKWCQAKQRWIEHVYTNSIQFYKSKKDKNEACRIMLGISKKRRGFDFHYTITWDNLTPEEVDYWEVIEGWVNWFSVQFQVIEQEIDLSTLPLDKLKIDVTQRFLASMLPKEDEPKEVYDRKIKDAKRFCDYLFDCYEKTKQYR